MLKPFTVADQLYDKEALVNHREHIIQLRDAYLAGGDMTWAVILSHNIGILAEVIKEMPDGPE